MLKLRNRIFNSNTLNSSYIRVFIQWKKNAGIKLFPCKKGLKHLKDLKKSGKNTIRFNLKAYKIY